MPNCHQNEDVDDDSFKGGCIAFRFCDYPNLLALQKPDDRLGAVVYGVFRKSHIS